MPCLKIHDQPCMVKLSMSLALEGSSSCRAIWQIEMNLYWDWTARSRYQSERCIIYTVKVSNRASFCHCLLQIGKTHGWQYAMLVATINPICHACGNNQTQYAMLVVNSNTSWTAAAVRNMICTIVIPFSVLCDVIVVCLQVSHGMLSHIFLHECPHEQSARGKDATYDSATMSSAGNICSCQLHSMQQAASRACRARHTNNDRRKVV